LEEQYIKPFVDRLKGRQSSIKAIEIENKKDHEIQKMQDYHVHCQLAKEEVVKYVGQVSSIDKLR
jgi:hypothetical protein